MSCAGVKVRRTGGDANYIPKANKVNPVIVFRMRAYANDKISFEEINK